MIVGLPGIGNVGNLAAEHIRKSTKAERFATLYSPYFLHQTIMLRSGGLRLVSNRFYHFNSKGKSVILLLGDTQASSSEGQYEINELIVKFFKKLGGKKIYAIGGYNASNKYTESPNVFGVSTDKKLKEELEKHGVKFGKITGTIWGSAGLIPAFARKYKIPAACVMGETGFLEIDASAARAVLRIMESIIGVKVDSDNLDKLKKETERVIKEIESSIEGHDPSKTTHDQMPYIR